MIEVRLSNGDTAEAETPEAARYAAAILWDEAQQNRNGHGWYPGVTFFVDGQRVAHIRNRGELS